MRIVRFLIDSLLWLAFVVSMAIGSPGYAQHLESSYERHHEHDASTDNAAVHWEGSVEGKAYSEFNHHLAGAFVLLIGLAELRAALALGMLPWLRFVLPLALFTAGAYLIVWSDHDAWPIGSQSFLETFVTGEFETIQHKIYAVFLIGVGAVETLGRMGRIPHAYWRMPLPLLAILAGIFLFLHSHDDHPAGHMIALHHIAIGTMAVLAGSFKLAGPLSRTSASEDAAWLGSRWDAAWACLILIMGVQLLIYTE